MLARPYHPKIKGIKMLKKLTGLFNTLAGRYLPDAYIFALILTIIVFGLGVLVAGKSPSEMTMYWGNGFWNLLAFSMQMAMILLAGFALAKSEPVKRLLCKLALLPKNNTQAVLMVTVCSSIACYINWGFGLVSSALLATEVARTLKRVNYGLLISSAYSGFLLWHGGLSGSIPLKLTEPSKAIQEILGVDKIGVEHTLSSSLNVTLLLATFLAITLLNYMMAKDTSKVGELNIEQEKQEYKENRERTPASRLESSWILNGLVSLIFLAFVLLHFKNGGGLSLNMMIFIFLGVGIVLHGRPSSYLEAFNDSVKGSSGILLQFPFYAGIMAMMSSSGLASMMSEFFISISNSDTFLFFSYISAGIVNFFVPSGGGQWAVQGPIILPAAKALGVNLADASMALAWGDAWTNMIQPFWALPLLAAGRCRLKDMMGYSAIVFLLVGLVQSVIFFIF